LPTAAGWSAVRLRQDERALGTVRNLLAAAPEVPTASLDDASLRELFVLLCSHDQLFLCLEGTS
jgi:hypothetical protein